MARQCSLWQASRPPRPSPFLNLDTPHTTLAAQPALGFRTLRARVSNLAQRLLHTLCNARGSFPCPPGLALSTAKAARFCTSAMPATSTAPLRSSPWRRGENMSPAPFVGALQDLQGSCRRNTRIAFAINCFVRYRKIEDADLCSAVEAVLIHALGGVTHCCSIPEGENTSALHWNRGGPQVERRPEI